MPINSIPELSESFTYIHFLFSFALLLKYAIDVYSYKGIYWIAFALLRFTGIFRSISRKLQSVSRRHGLKFELFMEHSTEYEDGNS